MPVFNWNYYQHLQPYTEKHLEAYGLRVRVEIRTHPFVEELLLKDGKTPPEPFIGTGILDTGATRTSIDFQVAKQLNLLQMGVATTHTAKGPSQVPTYAFSVKLAHGLELNCVPGMGCDLSSFGIHALIGMDLLSKGVFIVNGPGGVMTFAK